MSNPERPPQASHQRPIPLQMRGDLVVTSSVFQNETYRVLKDPVSLEYFRLRRSQFHLLQLLDGRRTLTEVVSTMAGAFPEQSWTQAVVQQALIDLHQKRLVVSNRPGQGDVFLQRLSKKRRRKLFQAAQSILYIRVPGWDPQRLLDRLYPVAGWMFHPLALTAATLLVLASWILLAANFDQFHQRLPEFQQLFSWPNIALLWLTMGMAKLVHELAHGLACAHYRVECHEIGVAFLVFSPCLYCDVSDSWMLAEKWKRIFIATVGMCIELTMSAIAAFLWWNSTPGLFNHLCLNVFFVTTISTVIYNANPLLRYDGYYILSDLLEIPNLRSKADRLLKHFFAWTCLGIKLPPDPSMPEQRRVWFVLYSIAAAIYRWVLLFAITWFLYNVLKPYGLQNLGLAMGVFSAATIAGNLIYQIYRIISEAHVNRISIPRVTVTCLVLAGLVCAACFIPLPLRQEAPLLIEPRGIAHVYTRAAGELIEIRVRPGQRVRQGQVLARLADPDVQLEYEQMQTSQQVQEIEVSLQRFLDDPVQQELAAGTLKAMQEQLAQHERRLRHLEIVAPCDGVVIAPPTIAAQPQPEEAASLERWSGTPLQSNNLGSRLSAGTHLLSVAPAEDLEAILLVEQSHRNDIFPQQSISVKLDHQPGKIYRGRIVTVSQRPRSIAPKALSNKFGSDVPTVTDAQGREELHQVAYEAVARLETDDAYLLPGTRGTAKFAVKRRTAGQWAWRWLHETIRFRM